VGNRCSSGVLITYPLRSAQAFRHSQNWNETTYENLPKGRKSIEPSEMTKSARLPNGENLAQLLRAFGISKETMRRAVIRQGHSFNRNASSNYESLHDGNEANALGADVAKDKE
jgi:hypothetical protein